MARKKKGLPFVVQPRLEPIIERVGSEESGIIEIQRKGYLTVAEKSIVDQASSAMDGQNDMLVIIREIAQEEGRSVIEIFEELQNREESELFNKYTEKIAAVSLTAQSQQQKTEIITATALLMCRIDPEWTVEQTMELHPDLLKGLANLYRDEDMRSLEAFDTAGGADNVKK